MGDDLFMIAKQLWLMPYQLETKSKPIFQHLVWLSPQLNLEKTILLHYALHFFVIFLKFWTFCPVLYLKRSLMHKMLNWLKLEKTVTVEMQCDVLT